MAVPTQKTKNTPGRIDLLSLFEAGVKEFISATTQGRILHGTNNIRDSGALLEARVREFIGERLPAPFKVKQGYLFDAEAFCTPQIDALIIDEGSSNEIMRSGEGATYTPYSCGHVIIEIKNSASGIKSHLNQIAVIEQSIRDMKTRANSRWTSGGPVYHPPLTILIISDSSKASLADFKKWAAARARAPAYTVLLDRGIIVAAVHPVPIGPYVYFTDHRQGFQWMICKPSAPDEFKCGAAFMWVYFSIIAHLNWVVKGNMTHLHEFTQGIEARYPLIPTIELALAKKW